MILVTDLAKHFDFVSQLKAEAKGALEASNGPDTNKVLFSAIKFCDLGTRRLLKPMPSPHRRASLPLRTLVSCAHPSSLPPPRTGHCFKPWGQHKSWSYWITEELFAVGDRERLLLGEDSAISALCDRQRDTDLGKNQKGFFGVDRRSNTGRSLTAALPAPCRPALTALN